MKVKYIIVITEKNSIKKETYDLLKKINKTKIKLKINFILGSIL